MILSSLLLATVGVVVALQQIAQVLQAAFVESLTGWIIGLMSLVAGGVWVGAVRVLRGTSRLDCEIEDGALVLRHGHCCRHRVPLGDLNLEQSAITDLSFDPGYQPRRRLAERGCPRRGSGWYQLRNGSRAMVFLDDPKNMVRIPTHSGYTLLLSVPEPTELLERLRVASEVCSIQLSQGAAARAEPKRHSFSSSTVRKQPRATATMAIHERASSGVV